MKKTLVDRSAEEILNEIKSTTLEDKILAFDPGQMEKFQIQILPDLKVKPSEFLPSPKGPGVYLAHPSTIRAVRKDIFMTGQDYSDYEEIYTCQGCQEKLDIQFWHHCPFCQSPFSKELAQHNLEAQT